MRCIFALHVCICDFPGGDHYINQASIAAAVLSHYFLFSAVKEKVTKLKEWHVNVYIVAFFNKKMPLH